LSAKALQEQGAPRFFRGWGKGLILSALRIALALCATTLALAAPSVAARAQTFQTSAPFAALVDYQTGAVLFEKNADQPMNPAATAKLLTAEIVFREVKEGRLHLDDSFEVSENSWRNGGGHSHGPATFLSIHSRVRVEDLLRGLIIQAGNDAAMTLAEGISGTEDNFAVLMNKRAGELGLIHSTFANARGKSDPRQHVTARDMAALAIHIIHDDADDYHYFSEKDFTWDNIHQLNRDPLLTMDLGADGLMAGDAPDSGYGLVGSAIQGDQRLIVVVNGLKTATDRAEEARKLLNWGFRSFDPRLLFQPGDTVGTASVYGGEQSEVPLTCEEPVKIFLARGSQDKLTAKIVYVGPLPAPVAAGVEVARLKVWRGQTLALDVPLKTQAAIPLGGLGKRALDAGVELALGLIRKTFTRN
jgi:D-alanyl-D-alanine carboxypeptidase (penicillin-binding protein 5/6)